MRLTYPAIFYEGEGGYAVEVPDLPGYTSRKIPHPNAVRFKETRSLRLDSCPPLLKVSVTPVPAI